MQVIDISKPINLSRSRIADALNKLSMRTPYKPAVIYFPSRHALNVSPNNLATPWESSLQGLRIADFRGTGLRFLTRDGNQVTWSRPIGAEDFDILVNNFNDFIYFRFGEIEYTFGHNGSEFVYSLETCTRILTESFTADVKPRLVPKIVFPEKADSIAAHKDVFPHFPWQYEDLNGRMTLTQSGAELVFESFGERGDSQFRFAHASEDEVRWMATCYMLRAGYFEKDANFTFDWIELIGR